MRALVAGITTANFNMLNGFHRVTNDGNGVKAKEMGTIRNKLASLSYQGNMQSEEHR